MANKSDKNFHTVGEIINFLQRYPEDDTFFYFLRRSNALEFCLQVIVPSVFSIILCGQDFASCQEFQELHEELLLWIKRVEDILDSKRSPELASAWKNGPLSVFGIANNRSITQRPLVGKQAIAPKTTSATHNTSGTLKK